MKKINLRSSGLGLASMLVAVLAISSCSKKETTSTMAQGALQLNLGISVRAFNAYSQLKSAHPEQFLVVLYHSDGSEVQRFTHASDITGPIQLPVGSYIAVAHSNNNVPAQFENDYYYGESEIFSIVAGQTQEVSLTCTLANIGVSVVYDDRVIRDFSDYETRVSNAQAGLVFGRTETRSGFFNSGPLDIQAVLHYTDMDGLADSLVLNGSISDAHPGTHYEIHIDAARNLGALGIQITANEEVDTVVVLISEAVQESSMTGELMIIMYNPSALGDAEGEYIEVYNTTQASINLNGWYLIRGTNDQHHQIHSDVILAPGQYAVLAASASAAAQVDYVYSGISLVNGGDTLVISTHSSIASGNAIVCLVDYGSDGFLTNLNGASLQLDPSVADVSDARLGSNWCTSLVAFSTGDRGTPGSSNADCQ